MHLLLPAPEKTTLQTPAHPLVHRCLSVTQIFSKNSFNLLIGVIATSCWTQLHDKSYAKHFTHSTVILQSTQRPCAELHYLHFIAEATLKVSVRAQGHTALHSRSGYKPRIAQIQSLAETKIPWRDEI